MATLTDPNSVSSETYSDLASRKIPFLQHMTTNMLFDVKGDLSVGKTVYFGENFTFGDAATDTLTITGYITFSADTRTVGIDLTDNCTTGIDIGTTTTGIAITGAATDGIKISSACADGIEISGNCTGSAINITGDTVARALMVGSFGTNLTLNSTRNYPVGVFGKLSASEDTTADVRCGWFRLRVNAAVAIGSSANWGAALKGVQGSLKLYGGTTTRVYSWAACGVFGSIETDGASTVRIGDGCVAAGVFAQAGLLSTSSGYTTIESGGVACGMAINNGSGTTNLTATGGWYGLYIYDDSGVGKDFTAGVQIDSSVCTTGVNIGTVTNGVVITGATAYAIDIATSGVFRMGVQDTGVDLTTTYPFAVEVQCEANADITAGSTGSSAGIYARYAIEYDQTSQCNHIAVFGKLRVKQDLADGNHCGVHGLIELSGTTELGGTSTTQSSAGFFALDCGTGLNLSTGYLNGVLIDSSIATGATTTGTTCGIQIKASASCDAFDYGILLRNSAATTGIDLGTMTTGISSSGTVTKFFNVTANLGAGSTALDGATLTVTDGLTAASGYTKGLCVAVNSSGTKTGSAWVNGIACDATITGAIPGGHSTFAQYSIINAAVAVGEYYGIEVYMDDNHSSSTITNQCGICIGIDNGEDKPTTVQFINCTSHGGTIDHVINLYNCNVTNLLKINTGGGVVTTPFGGAVTACGGSDASLKVLVNAQTYYIPLYDSLSS